MTDLNLPPPPPGRFKQLMIDLASGAAFGAIAGAIWGKIVPNGRTIGQHAMEWALQVGVLSGLIGFFITHRHNKEVHALKTQNTVLAHSLAQQPEKSHTQALEQQRAQPAAESLQR